MELTIKWLLSSLAEKLGRQSTVMEHRPLTLNKSSTRHLLVLRSDRQFPFYERLYIYIWAFQCSFHGKLWARHQDCKKPTSDHRILFCFTLIANLVTGVLQPYHLSVSEVACEPTVSVYVEPEHRAFRAKKGLFLHNFGEFWQNFVYFCLLLHRFI